MAHSNEFECKVVVVGDAEVGKSTLIKKFTTGRFFENYIPTTSDRSQLRDHVDEQSVNFVIWDTSGSPSYDSARSLTYDEGDVILLCFKPTDPLSLDHIRSRWVPEVRRFATHDIPLILCSCQNDLLDDTDEGHVSTDEALAVCSQIDAANYVETSARRGDVAEAFHLCALSAINRLDNVSAYYSTSSTSSKRKQQRRSTSSTSSRTDFSGSRNFYEDEDVFVVPRERSSSKALASHHRASMYVDMPLSATPPSNAQVRPNGLSRRTSFRSNHQQKQSIPVSVPISPPPAPPAPPPPPSVAMQAIASHLSPRVSVAPPPPSVVVHSPPPAPTTVQIIDIKSAASAERYSPRASSATTASNPKFSFLESSLNSHSGSNTGSTGSKASTSSSSGTALTLPSSSAAAVTRGCYRDPAIPDTEDPTILSQLQFVSPKNGVYRPIPLAAPVKNKKQQNCRLM